MLHASGWRKRRMHERMVAWQHKLLDRRVLTMMNHHRMEGPPEILTKKNGSPRPCCRSFDFSFGDARRQLPNWTATNVDHFTCFSSTDQLMLCQHHRRHRRKIHRPLCTSRRQQSHPWRSFCCNPELMVPAYRSKASTIPSRRCWPWCQILLPMAVVAMTTQTVDFNRCSFKPFENILLLHHGRNHHHHRHPQNDQIVFDQHHSNSCTYQDRFGTP
mmetsp:Transcript_14709/g.41640  ORF Transcript_14709/g.41640 Transcript_14709/m.41640 type:complete len:216 (+) Transcript_14709:689-1336(+)